MYDKDDESNPTHKAFNDWIKSTNSFIENDKDLEDKLGYKAPKESYKKPQTLIEKYLDNTSYCKLYLLIFIQAAIIIYLIISIL